MDSLAALRLSLLGHLRASKEALSPATLRKLPLLPEALRATLGFEAILSETETASLGVLGEALEEGDIGEWAK